MDQSIERRFCVYRAHTGTNAPLISCPHDQHPPGAWVILTGTQQECERYMRDVARLRTLTRQALGKE